MHPATSTIQRKVACGKSKNRLTLRWPLGWDDLGRTPKRAGAYRIADCWSEISRLGGRSEDSLLIRRYQTTPWAGVASAPYNPSLERPQPQPPNTLRLGRLRSSARSR